MALAPGNPTCDIVPAADNDNIIVQDYVLNIDGYLPKGRVIHKPER